MNLNKICLILKLIEINFGNCDRLNLIFWKFDNRYVLNWMRINFGVEEVLEIKFGKIVGSGNSSILLYSWIMWFEN